MTHSHRPFEDKFRALAGLTKDTVLGQTDKGEYWHGIVDQTQGLIMFSPMVAVHHTPHIAEEQDND